MPQKESSCMLLFFAYSSSFSYAKTLNECLFNIKIGFELNWFVSSLIIIFFKQIVEFGFLAIYESKFEYFWACLDFNNFKIYWTIFEPSNKGSNRLGSVNLCPYYASTLSKFLGILKIWIVALYEFLGFWMIMWYNAILCYLIYWLLCLISFDALVHFLHGWLNFFVAMNFER